MRASGTRVGTPVWPSCQGTHMVMAIGKVTGRYNFGGVRNDLSGGTSLALQAREPEFESTEPMFLLLFLDLAASFGFCLQIRI